MSGARVKQKAREQPGLAPTLARYVPNVIVRRAARCPGPCVDASVEKLTGAVLIADVAGFSGITELLAKQGAVGAETLNSILNDYFGRAIAVISAHGGDVVRFAGDALLAAWYQRPEEGGTAELTRRAVHCGLALQAELQGYQAADGLPLSIKVGIGAGEFVVFYIGGVRGRWEFLVSGPAFIQSFTALERAAAGQVAASLRTWSHVNNEFVGHQLSMGSVLVEAARAPAEHGEFPAPEVTDDMATALAAFIPGTVTSCLQAGQEDWLGELRVVSVLFVNLPELNYATPLEKAQQIMRGLQTALYRFEGSVNKLNVDEKGTSLVAALGLPPLSHEDDPRRAVQAARAISRALEELGVRSSIGISTGRVFCGSIGGPRRREYTVLGDAVNLAARLMQAALGDILCDETTFHAARSRIEFERLPDVMIKGKAGLVAVYRPLDGKCPAVGAKTDLVGRCRERKVLADGLRTLAAGGETRTIVLEGEAGIGKSRLVSEMLQSARASGVNSLAGAGDAVEAATLYYAWRLVFHQLFGLDRVGESPAAQRRCLLDHVEPYPALSRLAPLLEAVAPCGLADNELTASMTGQVRGDNTRALLLELLTLAAERSPTLVILDDAHWQDSASWALTSLVARRTASILLVLVTRPFMQNSPAEYGQVLRGSNTTYLRLDRLALGDTSQLVGRCLGVTVVPEEVAAIAHEKAEGNPLFVEELTYALREGGLLRVEEGRCRLAALRPGWSQLGVPDTLRAVVASRIDRLGTPQQLAVKVASVIGHHFHFRALHDNYPLEGEKPRLRGHLTDAQRAEIIGLDTPEPEAVYRFRHVVMQQVAYELLLFEQRQQLHHAVAEWYEKSYADNLAPHYPFLAHQWRHAGEPARAVEYLEKAGEQALGSGGYSEAARFFGEALRLDLDAGLGANDSRRARWERRLGEAYLGLGRLPDSREHLLRAIQLLGRPAPATQARLLASVAGHVVRQVLWFPFRTLFARDHDRRPATADRLEAARAYERLAEIYYMSNEKTRLVHAFLATLNLIESAGPSPELARAYASNSFTAGLMGLHRLARAYARDALATAKTVGDPVAMGWVLGARGIYALGMGHAAAARPALEEAIAIYRRLGDWQHWGECMAMNAQAAYCQGQFRQGLEIWNELYAAARNRGDRLQQAWAFNGQADGLLKTGEPQQAAEAVSLLNTAVGLFTENTDKVSAMASLGLRAVAKLRVGDFESARQDAEEDMRQIEEFSSPTSYYMLHGYAGVASTLLALWEANIPQGRQAPARLAGKACRALARYARTFPLAYPIACLCGGQAAWLSGRRSAAWRAWKRCILAAARLDMPYEQALAHYEIARHLPPGAAERGVHLARACEIFAAVEARFDLVRARQLAAPINGR